jgi:DNA-binding XRE family transcriptional regulator
MDRFSWGAWFCEKGKTFPQRAMALSRSKNPFLAYVLGTTMEGMTRSQRIDPDAALFGAILRRERLARGWTIRKLAQRAGMNAQYLGVVEAGRNVPSLSLILEVCEVLGADAGAMVGEVAERRRMPKA